MSRRQMVSGAVCGTVACALPWSAASQIVSVSRDEPAVDPGKVDLIYRSKAPRNAEPRLRKLVENQRTPTSQFYIRSHGANPVGLAADLPIEVGGLVDRPHVLTVQDLLRQFPRTSCVCTVSCAGIRRQEFMKVRPIKGVDWAEGPIGNAEWSGVRLSDVLKAVGVKPEARHIWFDGADQIVEGQASYPFGASIPLSKLQEEDDAMPGALLATEMNGAALPADHGFPVRVIVPGYIGARSVKWLRTITLSDKPSTNHFVADVYKMVYSQNQAEIDETAPIYRYPINAAACAAEKKDGAITVRGYALPTGRKGCRTASVEVSIDGGASWQTAKLEGEAAEFCWQFWSATLSAAKPDTEVVVRATDSLGHSMPPAVPWNPKGYLFNAWHRISLRQLLEDRQV